MNLIEQILAAKKIEVAQMPSIIAQNKNQKTPSVNENCRQAKPFIIAEIKPQSPNGKQLIEKDKIDSLLQIYNRHAAAISVLCDQKFFNGGYDLLEEVTQKTNLPVLAKEFFIDPKQIHLASAKGASAILLIPGLLAEDQCLELLNEALGLDLEILIEFHNPSDLKESLKKELLSLPETIKRKILIGVNNRDLRNLQIDLNTTKTFMPILRQTFGDSHLYISESGIKDVATTKELAEFADGFLIGTAFLQADQPNQLFKDILCN